MRTLFFTFLLSISYATAQHDWPMVNGGPQRRSWAASETALAPPFQHTYEYLDCPGVGNITCKGNMLFFGMSYTPNRVTAYRFNTADTVWSFEVPNSANSMNNAPAVGAGLVLTGGQKGLGLYALHAESGAPVWSRPVGSMYNRHCIIDGSRAYLCADSVYCLDVATGRTIWTMELWGQSTPAVDGDVVYLDIAQTLQALDKNTGQVIWSVPDAQNNALAVDESYVYNDNGVSLSARNKSDGSVEWTYTIPGGAKFPNLDGDAIAVSDKQVCAVLWSNEHQVGELFALNKLSGAFLWRHEFPTQGVFTPSIANGIVYVVEYQAGKLHGFDAATGTQVFVDSGLNYHDQPIVAGHGLIAAGGNRVRMFRNTPTDIGSQPVSSQGFFITDQYPNPAQGLATISYRIDRASSMRLYLCDAFGRNVRTLVERTESPGEHHVTFETRFLPCGVYFAMLERSGATLTKRILVVR